MLTTAPADLPAVAAEPRWFFGGLAYVRASAADTGGHYSLVEISCPPGLEAPPHVHYTEDEGFYVIEGSLVLEVDGATRELRAGDHAFGPRRVPHRYSVGPDGVRMLWILTPGGFEDFLNEASVAAAAPTLPPRAVEPPADAPEIARRHGKEMLV